MPLWIGGRGERKTLRMAAQYADGWNVPYIGPEEFARLSGVLDVRCDEQGRDPATIDRTVNLQFNLSPTEAEAEIARQKLVEQWGDQADRVSEGALQGTPDDAFDRVSMYCDAGAAGVNVALRAPWSEEALAVYINEVVPALREKYGARRTLGPADQSTNAATPRRAAVQASGQPGVHRRIFLLRSPERRSALT